MYVYKCFNSNRPLKIDYYINFFSINATSDQKRSVLLKRVSLHDSNVSIARCLEITVIANNVSLQAGSRCFRAVQKIQIAHNSIRKRRSSPRFLIKPHLQPATRLIPVSPFFVFLVPDINDVRSNRVRCQPKIYRLGSGEERGLLWSFADKQKRVGFIVDEFHSRLTLSSGRLLGQRERIKVNGGFSFQVRFFENFHPSKSNERGEEYKNSRFFVVILDFRVLGKALEKASSLFLEK